ncbi:hypothetical protein H7171_00645 [Candidatus Saccharibacteria bacterium]|nr:hypothetical protein [Candidatus Saccharibacteria bacterium]
MVNPAEQFRLFEQPGDVEALYANRDELLPRLDDQTLAGVKSFLRKNNFNMIAGSVCIDPEATVTEAIELGSSRLLQTLINNSILGPYIDRNGIHYPSGIGYWTADTEQAANLK